MRTGVELRYVAFKFALGKFNRVVLGYNAVVHVGNELFVHDMNVVGLYNRAGACAGLSFYGVLYDEFALADLHCHFVMNAL